MKYLLSTCSIDSKKLSLLGFPIQRKRLGTFNLLLEELNDLKETGNYYNITDGYLRDLNKAVKDVEGQEISTVQAIANSWPPPSNITGSFTSLSINKDSFEISLCNDVIGIYPVYILEKENELYISNSIILMGAITHSDFDEAGIVQRCIGPEYTNIGRRTILKNCKRLLPGEFVKFNSAGERLFSKFDNSLYQNISSPAQKNNLHVTFWENFKKEIAYSLNTSENVNIALSGGLDSRLILGAISKDKNISCYTYGAKENYETKIASRVAKIKGTEFKNYSDLDLYFPDVDILKKYTLETEALIICSWLEILEHVNKAQKEPMLLGDMTEVLMGRNIRDFNSKQFRQSQFFKYWILKKDYKFKRSTSENFRSWKETVSKSLSRWYTENKLSQFDFSFTKEKLLRDLQYDMDEIFDRIEAHKLPFAELYIELFSWYIHSRIPMGKQVLICNHKFEAFCPSMSLGVLRMASSIHPNLRLSSRFMNKLFKHSPELKKLNRIPTSQAPLISQNSPDFIKFPIWGFRSKMDTYLIKRMVKKKDVSKRYRLFKSINWAKVYQNPNMEKNLMTYFKNNHLGANFFTNLLEQTVQRKKLEQWPFANTYSINASSLNMEIDLIKKVRGEG